MMQELDEFDKKLLNQLQQNNRVTAEELGKMLNLSTSAVQRRLKRLRQDKIIEADISVVSQHVIGMGVTCIVEISLELGSSREIDSFKTLLSGCTEVMQCYYVTGSFDFIIIVNAKDMKHYDLFSKQYLMDNPSVRQFCTHVVLDKVKINYGVNI
jgi:Lrp/AsnC family leucine-responsive transcriptional regulator